MFPDWERCSLHSALSAAYAAAVPELIADYPMHPDSDPDRLAGDWRSEIAESAGFCDPAVAVLLNTVAYSSSAYADLLQTHSDHILLEDGRRRELLAAIREAIGRHGGWFSLPFKVSVCSATRLRR